MLPTEMPENTEPQPGSPSATDSAAPPATPSAPPAGFVTRDELNQVLSGINALAAAIQQGHVAQPTQPTPTIPTYDDPTHEQLANDLQSGDTKSLMKLLDNHEKKIVDRVVRPLEERGYTTLAQQARRLAQNDPSMPHFKRLEKDITEIMKPLTLAQRSDLVAYQTAYNIALGMNYEKLKAEEVQAAIRKANEPTDGGTLPSGNKPSYPAGTPTVKDLLGPDAESQIAANGWTPDIYAQKLYHAKDWPEAAKRIQATQAAIAEGNA